MQVGAVLAAAVGVGRFVLTPILPAMQHEAGVSVQTGSALATSNYLGYLLGAVAVAVAPRWLRTSAALRISGITVVLAVGAMATTERPAVWCALRFLAGAGGAVMFVIAAGVALSAIPDRSRHVTGWSYGGVGAGIAASGLLVLAVGTAGTWRQAWSVTALFAGVLVATGWRLGDRIVTTGPPEAAEPRTHRCRARFGVLAASYFLEGVGYIVAGTFLVAAVSVSIPPIGAWVWVIVGVAAIPSCAVWTWLGRRLSLPVSLAAALAIQSVGVATAAHGTTGPAVLLGAALFGATFMGVTVLSLAAGTRMQIPGAVAILSAVYAGGQVLGPIVVLPWLGSGFRGALTVAAVVIAVAAATAAALCIGRRPPPAHDHTVGPASAEHVEKRKEL